LYAAKRKRADHTVEGTILEREAFAAENSLVYVDP